MSGLREKPWSGALRPKIYLEQSGVLENRLSGADFEQPLGSTPIRSAPPLHEFRILA